MKTLVEQLRTSAFCISNAGSTGWELLRDAALRIERLEAENLALKRELTQLGIDNGRLEVGAVQLNRLLGQAEEDIRQLQRRLADALAGNAQ